MLADARASALVDNFAGQWLSLRSVEGIAPDPNLFPGFDENLREALRRETELFFESQLREDRSVVELLSADYTFLNERLARHYGIPGVTGSRYRRVSLARPGTRRGPAPRPPRPRQHPRGDLLRQPHLAGAPGEVAARERAGDSARPAAAGHPAPARRG